jgi:hypothetical protein
VNTFSFTAEEADLLGAPAVVLKISGPSYEINVWLRPPEVRVLDAVPNTSWQASRAIRAGTCAGASVFWSCDDGEVFISVGDDDESWDLGISFPLSLFSELMDDIENENSLPP